ncbi:MAG: hypothetical protein K2G29_07055 [Muribaculaceae bacterium]|nr:hypothetical protein [Muribaculaceae bacterium]MDE6421815.1 hypothetical protein [Muribaculaceae bacterium]
MSDNIPKAISNLRLIKAFRGLATDVMNCITASDVNPLYIVDDELSKISRFASDKDIIHGGFIAYNPDHHHIYLLAIDHMLLDSIAGGVADCAIFSLEDFTFIEFKTNAEGKSQASVEYAYHTAINQIENTLNIFIRHLSSVKIDFLNQIEVTAHMVVSPKFPRSSTLEQQMMIEFFDKNQIELSFNNHKTIS